MRIPILLNFDPVVELGPKVLIPKGTWRISCSGVIDSVINIITPERDFLLSNGNILEINSNTPIQALFLKIGREQSVDIFAERVD